MKNGKCKKKNYPKEFHKTAKDENGFGIYKRSNNQRFVIKGGAKLDNR
jgi:hypothetical protein